VVDSQQDLDRILCWREQRQVLHQLVINYSRSGRSRTNW
jgi:hypothetical protein